MFTGTNRYGGSYTDADGGASVVVVPASVVVVPAPVVVVTATKFAVTVVFCVIVIVVEAEFTFAGLSPEFTVHEEN